jgi:gelsolin
MLGGKGVEQQDFHCSRPMASSNHAIGSTERPNRLFRLSDASRSLEFEFVNEGQPIRRAGLDGNICLGLAGFGSK